MARGTLLEPLDWQAAQEEWLNARGLTSIDICFDGDAGCRLEDIFGFMQARNPHTYYLLGGRSPRGTNHTVVCCGPGFEWDPHPDGGFLVGPLDNGFWEATFILPLSMKAK